MEFNRAQLKRDVKRSMKCTTPKPILVALLYILQNLEAISADKEKDRQKAKAALMDILSMEKRLPEDFDYEKELMEARTEKYDSFS